MHKIDILSLTQKQMDQFCGEIGQPKFRALQIFQWLHQKRVTSFEEMHNLPQDFIEKLKETAYITRLQIKRKLVSELDGTIKFLFALADGNTVETVLMKYHHGNSLCVSTQVGCRMGCSFCASGLLGLERNLTAGEILAQIYETMRDTEEKISSVVLMGIGEPLDNYENVLAFLGILSSPLGLNLSLRHLSLSTCGLVDQIYRLMEEKLQLTLSISLHAPNDAKRDLTMPINKRYPMDMLLKACKDYFLKTGRRVSFEYALIEGVNDSPDDAKQLSQKLRGMGAHVNLIPVNPVQENAFKRTSKKNVQVFLDVLQKNKINATVRRELGSDIQAACGQLRREDKGGR